MKKATILFFLVISGFLFTSATYANGTEPDKPQKAKTNLTPSEDLSEFCKPDWSGYDTLSPDISTRPFLYPNKNDKKKVEKKKVEKKVMKQPIASNHSIVVISVSAK